MIKIFWTLIAIANWFAPNFMRPQYKPIENQSSRLVVYLTELPKHWYTILLDLIEKDSTGKCWLNGGDTQHLIYCKPFEILTRMNLERMK